MSDGKLQSWVGFGFGFFYYFLYNLTGETYMADLEK